MELHFCDVCSESVPEIDLTRGEAVERGGRVVCRRCEQAMSVAGGGTVALGGAAGAAPGDAAPPAGSAAGSGTGSDAEWQTVAPPKAAPEPIVSPGTSPAVPPTAPAGEVERSGSGMAWVAMIFTAVLAAVLLDKLGSLEERVGGMELSMSDRLASLESTTKASRTRQERQERETVTALREAREASAGALARGLSPVEREAMLAREGVDTLGEEVAALGRTVTSTGASLRGEGSALRERIAVLEEVRSLSDKRLVALEERRVGFALPTSVTQEPVAPEWLDSLEKLSSGDAMVRMEAVYALGESRNAGVAPFLLPLLEDGDSLVCMAVVRILGDLGAKVAVPALIETLDHDHRAVREGAVIALRGITRRSFNYDPAASEEKRRARRDAWRGWWARDGDDFMTEE